MDIGPVQEVRRTHLSVVLLTEEHAIKSKRPVDLGFVDFTTRAARRAACEAEVRLNRRLAPDVYLGVIELDGGEPAVLMRRLPDDATLLAAVERGEADAALLERVARRLAAFHDGAETSEAIAGFGAPEVVMGNALENFSATTDQIGRTVHATVHARAWDATRRLGAALDDRFRERVRSRRVRDCHGDLRLEHVYLLDGEVVVLDCVEFADRFRFSDVVSDMAFLYMDLAVRGHRALADRFAEAWLEATGDEAGRELLPFYSAYRSAVRGKVRGLVPGDEARSRRHWLFAWGELAARAERPVLVGVGGLPGTGKSTLARGLGERGFEVVRSDVVRKELAGLAETDSARAGFGHGLYTDAARDEVYAACFERAGEQLFAGRRVVVDASFTLERWREGLLALGRRWGVPVTLLRCEAPEAVVLDRLGRRSGDASDADAAIYRQTTWEPEVASAATVAPVDAGRSAEVALQAALAAIRTR